MCENTEGENFVRCNLCGRRFLKENGHICVYSYPSSVTISFDNTEKYLYTRVPTEVQYSIIKLTKAVDNLTQLLNSIFKGKDGSINDN